MLRRPARGCCPAGSAAGRRLAGLGRVASDPKVVVPRAAEDRCPMPYEPVIDADLTLGDGRNLAYCIWGDPNGRPMFLFHGSPVSRVFAPNPVTTEEFGVRLITVDRPG